LRFLIALGRCHQYANARQRLLCARRERPRRRRSTAHRQNRSSCEPAHQLTLEQISLFLNREDSQRLVNERVYRP
jgi:hypothetical protein